MWFFRSPQIVFGADALSYLSTFPVHRAVLVVDRNVAKTPLLDKLLRALPEDAKTQVVGDIPEEPKYSEMARHLEEVRRFEPDWFVALGGGSTIDTAKVLFFGYERPDLTYYDLTPLEPLHLRTKSRLIAIPTTSGTGSECTWAAVVTEETGGRKNELASPEILPDVSILDPEMVLSLPPGPTRTTAIDALTHAVEAYASAWSNPFSDALAEKAFEMITETLERVLAAPSDLKARERVHIAASMAGLSFSNAQIGLAHALGHALGARFKMPHGEAVGLFLPYVVSFNYEAAEKKYDRLNERMPDKYRAARLDASLFRFLRGMGQPLSVAEAKINAGRYASEMEDLVLLAAESTGMTTNARDATTDNLREILAQVARGRRE
jgi:alcohol dehydrogenase class IV